MSIQTVLITGLVITIVLAAAIGVGWIGCLFICELLERKIK
jgi:hypothetical protein